MELRGIDVSKWNGLINWEKVKASGIDFVMIKAANGSNKGTYSLDPKFSINIKAAYDAGLYVGVYLYSYAKTAAGALGEAKFLVSQLESYRKYIDFPVVFDIEDTSQRNLGKSVITQMCINFCDTIRAAGYTPMLYSNPDWLINRIDHTKVNADVWLAQWASKPTWGGKFTMWQYSDKGSVSGIPGAVDMNIGYVNYAAKQTPINVGGNVVDNMINKDKPSAYAAVSWEKAKALKVIDGTNPQGNITREQIIVILDRLNLLK